MIGGWIGFLALIAICVILTHLLSTWLYWLLATVFSITVMIWSLIEGDIGSTLLNAAFAAYAAWMCWRNRPPKDRIKRLVGAKARALRDRLVAAMPAPSRVPLPA